MKGITSHRVHVLVVAAIFIAAACGGGASPGPSASAGSASPSTQNVTVSIGVSTPLTGSNAVLGQPISQAVQLAVDTVNAQGGLPGKVVAVIEDDTSKPEVATSVANKFCSTSNMIGVIAAFGSGDTQAAQPVYNGCGLAQIAPAASQDDLTQRGFANFFRTTPRNIDQTTGALQWISNNLKATKFATIDANDSVTKQLAEQFTAGALKLGLKEVIPPTHVTTGQSDMRGPLTTMIAAGPDLIFVCLLVTDGGLAVKQARALGYKGEFWGLSSTANAQFVSLAGAENAEGMHMQNLGYDPNATPSAAKFVSDYKQKYGTAPTTYGANAYDGVMAIVQAWKAANGTTDRARIVAEVKKVHFDGTQGPIAFDSKGDLTEARIGIFQVKNGAVTFIGPSTQKQ